MDFPSDLNTHEFVYGRAELEQNVKLLLLNTIGSFLQSGSIGAKFSIHSSDLEELEEGVRATLEEIKFISIKSVKAAFNNIDVVITYNGEVINFQYPITNG